MDSSDEIKDFRNPRHSSEDVQWEIIRVPCSTANRLREADSQNVGNTMAVGMDGNASVADSLTIDERFNPRNPQDNCCFTTENHEINNSFDIFHQQREEFEIQQQFPNRFHDNFDDNMDSEEMENDMDTSEIFLKEIESHRHQAGPSTMAENDARELAFVGSNTNHLQDEATTSNIAPEEENNNRFHINYEDLIKKIERTNSSSVLPKVRRCSHPDPNGDLGTIKRNRNQLSVNEPKYSVISSKKRGKSTRNEQKELRAFLENTMKETHPELNLKDDIALKLQIFLWDMLHRIGDEAENLVMLSSKKQFDKRVLKYAIKLSLEKMKNEADVVGGKRHQWLF